VRYRIPILGPAEEHPPESGKDAVKNNDGEEKEKTEHEPEVLVRRSLEDDELADEYVEGRRAR